jgi:hypothetical protein
MLDRLCTEDKALWLNLLLREKYPDTPLACLSVDRITQDYKGLYMFTDSLIWHLYGLHYKQYTFRGPGFPIFDPLAFDAAIDKKILFLAENN